MKQKQPFARKRFGQHFLKDPSVVEQIVAAGKVTDDDQVIEIGPGRGALTERLAMESGALTVVELDRDLAADLKKRYQNNNRITVVAGDILKLDWLPLFSDHCRNKLIANLPYNISTPIFFKMVAHRHLLEGVVIMVQKELALRIGHRGEGKKLKDYGILSVIASNTFRVRTICQVSPACFSPPPKVESTVIHLTPKKTEIVDEEAFFSFIRKSFNNRRKRFSTFLRREYSVLYDSLSDADKGYLEGRRPEHLTPEQYLSLFKDHKLGH